jgi:hypothetical protein
VSQDNIEALLNRGIEAARSGNRQAARTLLEQVVEQDAENERAWFWMASVVDSDEERTLCLRTVLKINPDNQKARAALDKIEQRQNVRAAAKAVEDEEVAPGVARSQLTLLIAGALVIIVVVALFVVSLILSENARRAEQASQTQVAIANAAATQAQSTVIAQAATESVMTITAAAEFLAQTQAALASPTPSLTATSGRPTLPPEWTNTPLPSPTPTRELLAAPPPETTGRLIGWGDVDLRNLGFLPVLIYDLANPGSAPQRVGTEIGIHPRFIPGGLRIIYPRYNDLSFDSTIEERNLDGSAPDVIDSRWIDFIGLLSDADSPSYAPDGQGILFTAKGEGRNYPQAYLLRPDSVLRITHDEAEYASPDIAPNGSRVVVVRINRAGTQPVTDLVLVDVSSAETVTRPAPGVTPTDAPTRDPAQPTATPVPTLPPGSLPEGQTALTNDGSAFIEAMPRFSRDGSQIFYAAAPADAPDNHDIYMRPANGGDAVAVVISPGDDIYPVPSPDGRYIAFASNRTGVWDIYVVELSSGTLFQLTNSDTPDFPGDWID